MEETEDNDDTTTGTIDTPKRGRGRPPGAKNKGKALEVAVLPVQCPSCGSTERGRVLSTIEQEYADIRDGQPHTHIVRRRTTCASCGQQRIETSYENRI